ncbi:MAG TPA: hypothetical protein VN306_07150 [Mycobacterium sp.]|nr:hypothetical protein [Mycobacterium sp.]
MVEGHLCAAGVLRAPLWEMSGQRGQPPLDVFFGVGAGAAGAGCTLNCRRDQGSE